tara:strand:+ start:605 stop:1171 length:567 start_codon:yes stop_codon:yes gene_type:complete
MKNINKKYLEQCQRKSCFLSVPFKDKELKKHPYKQPSFFFNHFWKKYENFKEKHKSLKGKEINNSFNGQALEIILAYLFSREKIKIDKMDEILNDVKYVKPDFLITSKDKTKYFISAKVSIRERWKQADWEAIKYKEKYPNAKCFLIMNDNKEFNSIKSKIKDLDLDDVLLANSKDINNLINLIKKKD